MAQALDRIHVDRKPDPRSSLPGRQSQIASRTPEGP